MNHFQLVFVFFYLERLVPSNTETLKPQCDVTMSSRKGEIRIDRSTPVSCSPYITYFLNSSMKFLHVDVDIITSPHRSSNCDQALGVIVLPDESQYCQKENFCRIFHGQKLEKSQISDSFISSVKRKCNITWIAVEQWPPTLEVKQRPINFRADVTYEFLITKDRGRSLGGEGAPHNVKVEAGKTSYITPLAISIGAAAALALIVGIAWHTRNRRRTRLRRVSDISPYAIHVSIRRRSENRFGSFQVQNVFENHYDIPTSEQQPENEYLHPIRESPYYEIDNDVGVQAADLSRRDDDVYDMAESVGFREESRSLQTFKSNLDLFSSSDNVHYSNGEMFNEHHASLSESVGDISDVPGPSVSYGEIIGTMGKDGAVERFEPCNVTYKSIRKNR